MPELIDGEEEDVLPVEQAPLGDRQFPQPAGRHARGVHALQEGDLADPTQREVLPGQLQRGPRHRPFRSGARGEQFRLQFGPAALLRGFHRRGVLGVRRRGVGGHQPVHRRWVLAPGGDGDVALARAVVAVSGDEGVHRQLPARARPQVPHHRGFLVSAVPARQVLRRQPGAGADLRQQVVDRLHRAQGEHGVVVDDLTELVGAGQQQGSRPGFVERVDADDRVGPHALHARSRSADRLGPA